MLGEGHKEQIVKLPELSDRIEIWVKDSQNI